MLRCQFNDPNARGHCSTITVSLHWAPPVISEENYSEKQSWDSMEDCCDAESTRELWDVGASSRLDVIRGRYMSSMLGMTSTFCGAKQKMVTWWVKVLLNIEENNTEIMEKQNPPGTRPAVFSRSIL